MTQSEEKELQHITNLILKTACIEKIICFGYIINTIRSKSCFTGESTYPTPEPLNSYYLLVIPCADEGILNSHLQQRIDSSCRDIALVTAIIHRMEEINEALIHGSSFFITIYKKGQLLYDRGKLEFEKPGAGASILNRITKREKFWNKWSQLSVNLLKGAQFYTREGMNTLAVFMLHQSLQHCYSAMLRVLTGYRSNSNNLPRLIRLIENACLLPSVGLPRKTPQEARLSSLITKGFSDGRYNEKFEVSPEDADMLIKSVQDILNTAEEICRLRIEKIRSGQLPYTF